MRRRDCITLLAGAMTAWPLASRAQQKAVRVIGVLVSSSPGGNVTTLASLRQGLSETGYVEGQNLAIEYRFAEGHYDRLPALAAGLVDQKVNVIVALSPPAALASQSATMTIPIVFVIGGDRVDRGLVASLARPGGNLTGVTFLDSELTAKRLELLSELVPQARVITLLVNPTNNPVRQTRYGQEAARARGLQLNILEASTEGEIDAAFASLAHQAGALVIGADPFLSERSRQIIALASRHAVPTIYLRRDSVALGGLISYSALARDAFREAGSYVSKILEGAKPADLPVRQPTKFELVINLKTAKALGLTVPQALLARADEVIE